MRVGLFPWDVIVGVSCGFSMLETQALVGVGGVSGYGAGASWACAGVLLWHSCWLGVGPLAGGGCACGGVWCADAPPRRVPR